jgi:hypothetical protein
VSGAIVLDQIQLAKDLLGAQAIDDALQRMPPAAHAELCALLPMGWCSVLTAAEFHCAVAGVTGQDVVVWHRKVVRAGLERTFTTFWRFLMRLTSIEALVKRAAVIYGKSYDRGAMVARSIGPGHVEAIISGWPEMPDFELDAVRCGFETIVALAGRQGTVVHVARHPDGAVLDIRFVA